MSFSWRMSQVKVSLYMITVHYPCNFKAVTKAVMGLVITVYLIQRLAPSVFLALWHLCFCEDILMSHSCHSIISSLTNTSDNTLILFYFSLGKSWPIASIIIPLLPLRLLWFTHWFYVTKVPVNKAVYTVLPLTDSCTYSYSYFKLSW